MIAALAPRLAAHRTHLRVAFWLYAIALFTATHWPALELQVPYLKRPDLIIHFGCFGSWYALFWLAAYIAPPLRLRSVALCIPVAIAYAGFDEGLQGLPFVRRHCACDDFFANCTGILLAAIIAALLTLLAKRATGSPGASPGNP